MSIRDLGYRPYEGARLPPSHNVVVLLRYGLRRAWSSLLVKLAVVFSLFSMAAAVILSAAVLFFANTQGQGAQFPAADNVSTLLDVQLWLFVGAITLGAGAPAIAEDFAFRAFPFFFAKPVTPAQYLAGRIAAVATFAFLVCMVPATVLVLVLTGAAPAEQRLEWAGLILPAFAQSLLIAVVTASASVGVSSISKSRTLTMSAWLLLYLVPQVVGGLVFLLTRWPWLRLASLPGMLAVVGERLFRLPVEGEIGWEHALPMLGIFVAASIALARHRLEQAEVIQ